MREFEYSILYWFQGLHNPVLDKIAIIITSLGNAGIFWIILTVFMLIICKDKKPAWASGIALIISLLIVNILLKNLVARSRPCWDESALRNVKMLVNIPKDYSFPSGHSSASFAASVAIVQYRRKLGISLIILASIIALSRLYLFVHWPTDVLCGVVIGIFSGLISGVIIRYVYAKRK
mgnify:CR=1 FL=1